jgi:methylase of polypeptide subunit release factors
MDAARASINQLVMAAETLAAVGLALAQQAGDVSLPDDFRVGVDAVARGKLGDLSSLDPRQAKALGSLARALLAQAAAFSTNPQEPAAWAVTDPVVLQSQGQASAALAVPVCDAVVPRCAGLSQRLEASGSAILDVGSGVGALALAFAHRYPSARVVGLDVWEPALTAARGNVAAADMSDRVEIRKQDVAALDEHNVYDLVWFAGPFIPGAIVADSISRVAAACRPGGVVVYGTFGGLDPMSSALANLRILRSGGPVIDDSEIERLLVSAGLEQIEHVGADIGLPARLIAGRRP